jgi:hypothetical protein
MPVQGLVAGASSGAMCPAVTPPVPAVMLEEPPESPLFCAALPFPLPRLRLPFLPELVFWPVVLLLATGADGARATCRAVSEGGAAPC